MPEKTNYGSDSLTAVWRTAVSSGATLWCGLMHDAPMWPIHGQYECRTCGRLYFVPWAGDGITAALTSLASAERPHAIQAFHRTKDALS
jgi:hypothetical protein